MATNLAINLSEDNMLAQVTGPDDLKNYFHMDPLGDLLLLDSKMLPIPLSAPRPVTAYQKISPNTFWNNRQTRQGTTNTTSPLPKHLHSTSLPDHHASSPFHVTSPIPLEDIRSIIPPGTIGRAAKFVNHPDNLPDIDFVPEQTATPLTDNDKDHTKHTHNLRKSIKAPAKLDL